MRRSVRFGAVLAAACLTVAACQSGDSDADPSPTSEDTADESTGGDADASTTTEVGQPVADLYDPVPVIDGGFVEPWSYFGWAAEVTDDSVTLDLGDWGGMIAADPGHVGSYAELVVVVDASSTDFRGEFMRVGLADAVGSSFPIVHPLFEEDGAALRAVVPMRELLGGMGTFDRIVLSAMAEYESPAPVEVEEVYLVPGDPYTLDDAGVEEAEALVECTAEPTPISPYIYGLARGWEEHDEPWGMEPAVRRWGGNPTSRYNPANGAWNTALDYFWTNYSLGDVKAHEEFLFENWDAGVESAVTVPMLGWVSKDVGSYAFPVSEFGEQEEVDPFNPDAGNGIDLDGEELPAPDPEVTSVRSTPDDVRAYVESIEALADATGNPSPMMYFLDNEPMIWHVTHRDVYQDLLSYDELLARTIEYGTVVREAAPDALIAGPSVWGWPAYFYSAVDAEGGFNSAPDRADHAGQGLIEWYLDQLRQYEERTGVRLLDVLDVHYYPQGGVYGNLVDEDTSAYRLRSTRSLWDPAYSDESWIQDTVRLLPRMQRWVEDNYPGTKLSIGEYSWGAEGHLSGGLSQAEALGRFGQYGLYSAYYWFNPPEFSPVYWAFRAYRNYDGNGSTFGDLSLPTSARRPLSLFASADSTSDRNVLVLLNQSPDEQLDTSIRLDGCDRSSVEVYQFVGAPTGFEPAEATLDGDDLEIVLPPYSITVAELR